MKKSHIILTLIAVLMLFSISIAPALPTVIHDSVALSSSVSGGFVNPAVLSYGNGTGFGYLHDYSESGFSDNYTLYLHTKGLGYAFSSEPTDNYHTLSLSFPFVDGLYFGTSIHTANFKEDTTAWNTGVLIRPADYLSIGTTAYVPPDADATYTSGIALRPLSFMLPQATHRVSLFADMPWNTEEIQLPTLGLHLEPINGIQARFGYDLESESIGFSFSVALSTVNGGSSFSTDSSGDFQSGSTHLQLSPRPFNYPEKIGNELYYEYDLEPGIFESPQGMQTGPFFIVTGQNTLLKTLRTLEEIENDPDIKGLVFMNQHPQMSLSTMRELRNALLRLKRKGKKIIFYSDSLSTVEYTLAASTADALYLHPQGRVLLSGLSSSSPYLKTFLEKYGIEVANFKIDKYKTAYNFLSESSMTEAERESLNFMLEGLMDEIATLIEDGRKDKLNGDVMDVIQAGPYLTANNALSAGLVDKLLYEDEIEEEIPFFTDKSTIKKDFPQKQVRRDWSSSMQTKVALIYAVGPLHLGAGQPGASIGAETTAAAIREARENDQIKAILLRINSGGGSALAADIIAREIELCRSGENAKPVVVSMGGAAASGGYYMSAFADTIVASPFTLTGSIGVIAIFPNIADLLKKQQIQWDTVKQGPHADFPALYRPLTEAERQKISSSIEHTYNRFIDVVSEGRKLSTEKVEQVAGGRVWTGRQAQERELVDEIGGFEEAFDILSELLNTKKELELVNYTYQGSWSTVSLDDNLKNRQALKKLAASLSSDLRPGTHTGFFSFLPPEMQHFYHYYTTAAQSGNAYSLILMPYYVEGVNSEKNLR